MGRSYDGTPWARPLYLAAFFGLDAPLSVDPAQGEELELLALATEDLAAVQRMPGPARRDS